jgi:hypothetical protein
MPHTAHRVGDVMCAAIPKIACGYELTQDDVHHSFCHCSCSTPCGLFLSHLQLGVVQPSDHNVGDAFSAESVLHTQAMFFIMIIMTRSRCQNQRNT